MNKREFYRDTFIGAAGELADGTVMFTVTDVGRNTKDPWLKLTILSQYLGPAWDTDLSWNWSELESDSEPKHLHRFRARPRTGLDALAESVLSRA